MKIEIKKQIYRVNMLSDMLTSKFDEYENHNKRFINWKENAPKYHDNFYEKKRPVQPTHSELKRLMLILRQETIKLEKML